SLDCLFNQLAPVGLTPAHSHEKTNDGKTEADGIIPRAECGHKRDLLAGEVVDNNPCQADDHQTQHENDVPLRSTLSIYFDWGTVCCGACASGCSSRRWV